MYQAAILPSLTDSTVVSATPAKSPPHQTAECDVRIVFVSTTGKFPYPNLIGLKASITENNNNLSQALFECIKGKNYFLLQRVQNQMQK